MRWILAAAAMAVGLAAAAAVLAPEAVRPWTPEPLRALLPAADSGAGRGGGSGGGPRAVPVRLTEATTRAAVERFETSAEVLADDAVALASEVPGRVVEVAVGDGERVAAGDVVLRLEDGPERARVDAARAAAAEAEAEASRARQLAEEDLAAEARVETARAAAESARAELEAAQEALEERTLRAPFDGRIGFVDVAPGAYLFPGLGVVRLRTLDDLRIRYDLPLDAADAAIDRAAPVEVRSGGPDCTPARRATPSPLGDAASRTRRFEARLPAGCGLVPGAFVDVAVEIGRREAAVFVPRRAVLREGFETLVFRAEPAEDGGTVVRAATVELGVRDGPSVEVRSGLSAGDRVVASGIRKVRDGARVTEAGDGSGAGGEGGSGDGGADG